MKINRSYFLIFVIFIFSLAFFSQNLMAEDNLCTDKKDCFPESSSTWNMIDTQESVEKKRRFLKEDFNSLVKHRSLQYKKKLLIKQQTSWLKFVQDRCEFIGNTSGAGGHWPYVQTNVCLNKHYDSRIELIKVASNCLKEDYKDSAPDFGFNHCIENFHQIMDADRKLFN
jgi:uncharacterized protein YecT (DUF1311 family)